MIMLNILISIHLITSMGNLIIDLATGNYVLENIEITKDENISTLSGNIFDEKFWETSFSKIWT